MQTSRLLFVALVAFGLSACSWQTLTPPTGESVAGNPAMRMAADGPGYKLIYSFPGGAAGAQPTNGVTFVNGVAFGTAFSGGDVSGCNCGVIFTGAGKVIYTFQGGTTEDGSGPTGDLLLVGKELYGTTGTGGLTAGVCAGTQYSRPGCGTVFEVDTSGNERVVYRFKGGKDGSHPVAGLVYHAGFLYGATAVGGTACSTSNPYGCGTIFALDSSGHEKVIYRFKGGPDGYYPAQGLIAMNGAMYGMTMFGGGACPYAPGCGTVFRITHSGHESVLYTFKGEHDGMAPFARLIAVHGFLYGTTAFGGCLHKCPSYFGGFGTIFKLSPSGIETVLHRFHHWAKGERRREPGAMNPIGDLVFLNNQIYGTTNSGGCLTCAGSIYSVTLKGAVKILFLFNAVSGGAKQPEGLTLKPSTNTLFGNAQFGGAANKGAIYRYVP